MARTEATPGVASAHFSEHIPSLKASARIGPALDLAAGRGRHSLAAASLGLEVLAVDRNAESLEFLLAHAPANHSITTRVLDLESAPPPILRPGGFGAILVFRYLHRPLATWIEQSLAPGGLLLYETFTQAQRQLGWGPSRDEFLLAPGELSTLFPTLITTSYAEGLCDDEPPAQTARLAARRPA